MHALHNGTLRLRSDFATQDYRPIGILWYCYIDGIKQLAGSSNSRRRLALTSMWESNIKSANPSHTITIIRICRKPIFMRVTWDCNRCRTWRIIRTESLRASILLRNFSVNGETNSAGRQWSSIAGTMNIRWRLWNGIVRRLDKSKS